MVQSYRNYMARVSTHHYLNRQIDIQIDRQIEKRWCPNDSELQTDRQIYRQTDRQTNRQIYRQTDKQTGRQTNSLMQGRQGEKFEHCKKEARDKDLIKFYANQIQNVLLYFYFRTYGTILIYKSFTFTILLYSLFVFKNTLCNK